MKIDLSLPAEHYADFGCRYCDLRHSICGHETPSDKPCKYFKLGKCFKCSIRIVHDGEWVDGICSDAFDYAGCDNFKE